MSPAGETARTCLTCGRCDLEYVDAEESAEATEDDVVACCDWQGGPFWLDAGSRELTLAQLTEDRMPGAATSPCYEWTPRE